MHRPATFLCISFFFKGKDFMTACKAEGNKVYLLTKESLKDEPWPKESLDDIFYLPSAENTPENLQSLQEGVAYLLRSQKIDVIVCLDDFDVEKGSFLREHFRIGGMGQTTSRYFRDKLAMRIKADNAGIKVPPFSSLFNDDDINEYLSKYEAPYVIKPRSEAAAAGIKKVYSKEEAWEVINNIGEQRHNFLIEQFRPGDVYHADSLIYQNKMLFCSVSQYLSTPFEVAHGGGIFRSAIVPHNESDEQELIELNRKVLATFGLRNGASHSEFIKSKEDGSFYFLETSSRVGGAHLAEMVAFGSGINLWTEWAKIETAALKEQEYTLPEINRKYAGIVISLSKYEYPDQSMFNAPEVVWRLNKKNHVGLIIQSDDRNKVMSLLDEYAHLIKDKLHASAPAQDTAME